MEALAAVTIGAAYSWRMEHEIGSIAVGKLATFTVLADDPMLVDPESLHDIEVVGTIYEGQWHPAADTPSAAPTLLAAAPVLPGHSGANSHGDDHSGCSCVAARALARAYVELSRAA
jgi:urease alpha subunit